jgi:hypothetical protein
MIKHIINQEFFFTNEYKGDSKIIQKHIDHILEFDRGRIKTNDGGYQSNEISFGFDDLIHFALNSLNSIGKNVKLNSFWLNINNGYSSNHCHIHDLTGMSAVYYHKTCCNKSTLEFHHLVPTLVNYDCEYAPIEKTMVFFEANTPHSVNPCNNPNHERISIAFNFVEV